MTTSTVLCFFFNTALVILGAYAIYREKELIKFERKVKKYIKAFFKAMYYTLAKKEPESCQTCAVSLEQAQAQREEHEKMLKQLNKSSKIEDFLVA